ncbi:MAG: energy-coupling factor transporter transmembrane protein EcfT [Candidatus Competibacter sp.]|nr:energy-coupling factor transporter transmembrane protein EcfT [Candidatus Competibacter sp.]
MEKPAKRAAESLATLLEPSGRFDPRAKLIAYLFGFGWALLVTHPVELLALNAAVLIGVALVRAGGPLRRALRLLWPTLLLFGIIVGASEGPAAAAGAMLRLLALVQLGVWFFAATPPEELGESLLAGGLSPQTAFLLEGTLRFAPTMALLVREVMDAQESRGIRLDGVYLLRNGAALLAPLLADVMRFADDLAEALEARGFGGPQRTPLGHYRFRARDWLLVAGTASATLALLAVRRFYPALSIQGW